jgi:hypothetical protein
MNGPFTAALVAELLVVIATIIGAAFIVHVGARLL